MNALPPAFRAATPDDATAMVELVNVAGEGLPFYVWSRIAEQRAIETGRHGLSIIVADANVDARRRYEHCGLRERARRPMVKESWEGRGENRVLLVRDTAA